MRYVSLGILIALVCVGGTWADEADPEYPLEPALTTSPQATLKTFMETFREVFDHLGEHHLHRGGLPASQLQYYRDRLKGCLDLSEVPPALEIVQAEEAATHLKEVLDRIELPPESQWPDEAKVKEDGIDRWTIPHTEITIAKVEKGPKRGQYQYCSARQLPGSPLGVRFPSRKQVEAVQKRSSVDGARARGMEAWRLQRSVKRRARGLEKCSLRALRLQFFNMPHQLLFSASPMK